MGPDPTQVNVSWIWTRRARTAPADAFPSDSGYARAPPPPPSPTRHDQCRLPAREQPDRARAPPGLHPLRGRHLARTGRLRRGQRADALPERAQGAADGALPDLRRRQGRGDDRAVQLRADEQPRRGLRGPGDVGPAGLVPRADLRPGVEAVQPPLRHHAAAARAGAAPGQRRRRDQGDPRPGRLHLLLAAARQHRHRGAGRRAGAAQRGAAHDLRREGLRPAELHRLVPDEELALPHADALAAAAVRPHGRQVPAQAQLLQQRLLELLLVAVDGPRRPEQGRRQRAQQLRELLLPVGVRGRQRRPRHPEGLRLGRRDAARQAHRLLPVRLRSVVGVQRFRSCRQATTPSSPPT